MRTAYDLLMTAPDDQITRCRLAYGSIAVGNWLDAAHSLRNAARAAAGTTWAEEAQELADYCAERGRAVAQRAAGAAAAPSTPAAPAHQVDVTRIDDALLASIAHGEPAAGAPAQPRLVIAPAGAEHAQGWLRLWRDYCGASVDDRTTALTWARILDPESPIGALVAELGGHAVAFVTYVVHPSTRQILPRCCIEDVFVDKGIVGDRGIDRALAAALLARLQAGQWASVCGITSAGDTMAQRLHAQLAPGQACQRHVATA